MKSQQTVGRLLAHGRLREVLTYAAAGLALIAAIVYAGDGIARHIDAIEAWLSSLGPWGVLVFVALYVLATSLMVPESVLSIAAGALFGLRMGLLAVVVGSLIAAGMQYALARWLLHESIQRLIGQRPSLIAIQQGVRRDELKLQALLRLTPLSPATLSYMLGAAGVRLAGFLLASLAVFPHLLLEVYFGFAGTHVARLAGEGIDAGYVHDSIVIGGLTVTFVVMVLISRIAHKALIEAMSEAAAEPGR